MYYALWSHKKTIFLLHYKGNLSFQFTAETAYDMVSPGPTVKRYRQSQKKTKRKRMHRPQDIREGVANALQIVREVI